MFYFFSINLLNFNVLQSPFEFQFILFFFLDKKKRPGWPQILYLAEDDLGYLIFLSLPPECQEYNAQLHVQFVCSWGLHPGPSICQASSLLAELNPSLIVSTSLVNSS